MTGQAAGDRPFAPDMSGADGVVGRDAELAELEAFLDALAAGPAALAIEGEAGIGKSTLWRRGVGRAGERGWSVLTARPVEAEVGQSYAALADLFGALANATLSALPEPQRLAMEGVLLLRRVPPGDRVDARAVTAATAGMLDLAASRGPVLLAIDDVSWLDSASRRVIASVVRRLGELPVGILLTQRSSLSGAPPLALDVAFGDGRFRRVELAGFTRGALQQLIHRQLAMTFPRPTLARLHAASGGNPYVALEIARAIGRLGRPIRLDEPLPVPATVRALVRDRLEGLEPDVRMCLLVIAASATSTPSEIRRVIGDQGRADAALAGAERAGLVVIEGGRCRTFHPLLASTVYADADAAQRRQVHARLAEAAPDQESRARHLARTVIEPDERVAEALLRASSEARQRGAPEGAAELLRMAVELTPADGPALGWRRALLGTALLEIGSSVAATCELDMALATLPAGPDRAAAGLQRAIAAWYAAPAWEAERYAEAALADAAGDPALAARIEAYLSVFCFDVGRAAAHATAAIAVADAGHVALDPAVRALAIWQRVLGEAYLGRAPRPELLAEAQALGPIDDPTEAPTVPGIWALATGRIDDARAFFLQLQALAIASGTATSDADLAARLAEVELHADHWDVALDHVHRARAAAAELEQATPPAALRVMAEILARRGNVDAARVIVRDELDPARPPTDPFITAGWQQTASSIELTAGDVAAVEQLTAAAARTLAGIGVAEPLLLDTTADRAEALLALGRREEAGRLLADLERRHGVLPRAALAAAIGRVGALLAATESEAAAALEATAPGLDPASGWSGHDRLRTLLARGGLQRRRRDRKGASASLEAALAIARQLGAEPLRRRVEDELARLGRRRPGTLELTPTEEQVAELAGTGHTNREVAARLYMSPKTVEAHLARIYGKLGIASRAELGRTMAGRPPVRGAVAPAEDVAD